MTNQETLEHLAIKHGSDKHNLHFYMQHYARFFGHLREKPLNLLEIGVGGFEDTSVGGASLRIWRDFFPNAQIYGLDIIDKSRFAEERIKVFKGSQVDALALSEVIKEVGNKVFDIIIDDGSHINDHVIGSFNMLFPFLASDGIYVIEDLQTSYFPDYGGSCTDLCGAPTSLNFLKNLLDGLNWEEIHRPGYLPRYTDLNIVGMHFFHNMVFIEKGVNREGSNMLRANVRI